MSVPKMPAVSRISGPPDVSAGIAELTQSVRSIVTEWRILRGQGSPEAAVVAPVGWLYLREDGAAGTTAYVKEVGSGNTGWTAMATASSGEYYTKTEIDALVWDRAQLAADGVAAVHWHNITNTPTTIAGYGITNAYTKTEVNSLVGNYLPLAGGILTGALQGTIVNWVGTANDFGVVVTNGGIDLQGQNDTIDPSVRVTAYGSGWTSAFAGRRAEGTYAAPAAVSTARILAHFTSYGYDGTGFFLGSRIDLYTPSAWSPSSRESEIQFYTTPAAGTTPVLRARITSSGAVCAATDGTLDLGLVATRWRSLYLSTSLVIGADPGGSDSIRSAGGATLGTGITLNTGSVLAEGQSGTGVVVRVTTYATTAVFRGRRAQGTYAVPAGIDTTRDLVTFIGNGYDGSAFADGAALIIRSSNAWSITDHGSLVAVRTVPAGSTVITDRWLFRDSGHLFASSDNAYDIGATGATRPRSVYVGTSVVVGVDPGSSRNLRVSGGVPANAGARVANSADGTNFLDLYVGGVSFGRLEFQASTGQSATLGFNAMPLDGTSSSVFQFFRNTITTGTRAAQFFRGDGTATIDAQIGIGAAGTYFGAGQSVGLGGNLGLGTATPGAALHVMRSNGVNIAAVILESWYDTAGNGAQFYFRRARAGATTNPGIQSLLQSGDLIAQIIFQGWDGAGYQSAGSINSATVELWSSTAHGSQLTFNTTAVGTTGAVTRWTIGSASSSGVLFPSTDNTYDIGAAGARARTLYLGTSLVIGTTQVLGPRKTGWGTPTGTADRTTFTTYAAPTAAVAYDQTQMQALMDAVQSLSQHQMAVLADLISHGIFGA